MDLNPLDWLRSNTNEQTVLNTIAAIKKDLAVVETDINAAVNWLVNNAPSIIAEANMLMQLVSVVGAFNPQVSAALTAVNAATSALNTLAAATNAGSPNTAQALIAAYSAAKVASGQVALATSAVVAPAVAPSVYAAPTAQVNPATVVVPPKG